MIEDICISLVWLCIKMHERENNWWDLKHLWVPLDMRQNGRKMTTFSHFLILSHHHYYTYLQIILCFFLKVILLKSNIFSSHSLFNQTRWEIFTSLFLFFCYHTKLPIKYILFLTSFYILIFYLLSFSPTPNKHKKQSLMHGLVFTY